MDLRQLRSLAAIADEGQFTRAAERLGIAQSSLSSQIRLLEQELGLTLFDRTTRHLSLTEAGSILLDRARVILSEVADVQADLQRRHGLLSGHVSLGVTQTPGAVDVVTLLANFHRTHPAIELAVREDLSVTLADQLREDRIDLAILTLTEPEDCRGLEMLPARVEPLVVIVPVDHPLTREDVVEMARLRDEIFVMSPPGATIRATVGRLARQVGFEPRVMFESREVTRIRELVAAGLGIAFLPEADALNPRSNVATVRLADDELTHTTSLAWRARRRQAPAARALLDHARHALQR